MEYTFAQNGIFFHTPKAPMVAPGQVVKLRESMVMGTHVGSANDVHGVVNRCAAWVYVCERVVCLQDVSTTTHTRGFVFTPIHPNNLNTYDRLREEFAPATYHPVRKNCNHFSDALCQELVGQKIPAWINRPANIGRFFSFGGGGGGGSKDGKQQQPEKGGGKGDKAARQKKELTEEQKRRLEAIRRAGSS